MEKFDKMLQTFGMIALGLLAITLFVLIMLVGISAGISVASGGLCG